MHPCANLHLYATAPQLSNATASKRPGQFSKNAKEVKYMAPIEACSWSVMSSMVTWHESTICLFIGTEGNYPISALIASTDQTE
jgi:hypothetical protein